jgi:integrase
VAYRHGLRAKEACELEWAQVEFGRSAALHVRRARGGKASVHPIRGYELRMLTALRKAFPTQRRTPFTTDAINRLIKNTGNRAELPLPVHFHMLPLLRLQAGQRRDRYQGDPRLARVGQEMSYSGIPMSKMRQLRSSGGGILTPY